MACAINGSGFLYGGSVTVLLSFPISAAAVNSFLLVPVNALIARSRQEPLADPTTRKYADCLSEIPINT